MRRTSNDVVELQPYNPPQAIEYGSIRRLTQGDF